MPPVPFLFLIYLLDTISKVKPKSSAQTPRSILQKWIQELHRLYDPLPEGTFLSVMRLLLPEEDVRRRFQLKEPTLAPNIADCLGLSRAELASWNAVDSNGISRHACLGTKVEEVLGTCYTTEEGDTGGPTLQEIDVLLSELASKSPYSHESFRSNTSLKSSRSRYDIIKRLYRTSTPRSACFLTQIILKDNHPALYPSHAASSHFSVVLSSTVTKIQATPLTVADLLWAWDSSGALARQRKTQQSLEDIAAMYEHRSKEGPSPPQPISTGIKAGSIVQIPKCLKGKSCPEALALFKGSCKRIWAETKYDGERCQIHVQIDAAGNPSIKIYSKSQRDSTDDRAGIHSLVYAALGAPSSGFRSFRINRNVILEAEMVAYHEETGVDEFWRIRHLVTLTGTGPRSSMFQNKNRRTRDPDKSGSDRELDHDDSMQTTASDSRHLALVFFDILMIDDKPLNMIPYSERRRVLERLLVPSPGRIMFAERKLIDLSRGVKDGAKQLRFVFAGTISRFEEGLVLKAEDGKYNCHYGNGASPWVKLKKDYIPGYGDCMDVVALVNSNVWTTLHMGVLTNASELKSNPCTKPHFYMYFNVSWGFERKQLEDMNFRIKHRDPVDPEDEEGMSSLTYDFELFSGVPPPTVYFREPLLAEIYGGGFTKERGCKHYYPRFPRITKLHRLSERSWKSAPSLSELHVMARKAIGRDRSTKDVEDWGKTVWGKAHQISPRVRDSSEQEKRERRWVRNLEDYDRRHHGEVDVSPPSHVGLGKRKRLDGIEEEDEVSMITDPDSLSKNLDSDVPSTPCQPARSDGQSSPRSPLLSSRATNIKADSLDDEDATDTTPRPRKKIKFLDLCGTRTAPLALEFSSPRRRHLLSPCRANLPSPASSPSPLKMKSTSTRIKHPKAVNFPVPTQPPPHSGGDEPMPSPGIAVDVQTPPPLPEPSKQGASSSSTPANFPSNANERNTAPKQTILRTRPCKITSPGTSPLFSALLDTSFIWSPPQLSKHLQEQLSAVVDPKHRLHARFALWYGCGWTTCTSGSGNSRALDWVKSGILFVDSEELEREVLKECRAMCQASNTGDGGNEEGEAMARKPIYVLAAGILDLVFISQTADLEMGEYLLAVVR